MRFAIIDSHGNVLKSWDAGEYLRERLFAVVTGQLRFLPFRPKLRRQVEAAVDASLTEMVRQFGLDVSRDN